MNRSYRLTNVRVVTPEAVIENADLIVDQGRIVSFGSDSTSAYHEISAPGSWVIPGLIDIHSDHIEKVIEPRPRVVFPLEFALEESNQRLIRSGITTIFHSFSFAGAEMGLRQPETAGNYIRQIVAWRKNAPINLRIHLRYEISDHESLDQIEELLSDRCVDLISFMNHAPGQGQYPDDESYLRYLVTTYGYLWSEAQDILDQKRDHLVGAEERVAHLVNVAQSNNVAIACHDLDSPESATKWKTLGAHLAEFPLNLDAARAAHRLGLKTALGAPNIVRGQSSGHGLRAIDAIAQSLCDIVTSDYAPYSLLPALFNLIERFPDRSLPDLVNLFTTHPANALHLNTGRIQIGAPADLLLLNPQKPFASLNRIFTSKSGQI